MPTTYQANFAHANGLNTQLLKLQQVPLLQY